MGKSMITAIIICALAGSLSLDAQTLRHFSWTYSYDPPGHQRRDWVQESDSSWYENYEDGRRTHFAVLAVLTDVEGVPGTTVINDTRDIVVLIPSASTTAGTGYAWLRFRSPQSSSWSWSARSFVPLEELV